MTYILTATQDARLDNIQDPAFPARLRVITSGESVTVTDAEYVVLERAGLIIGTSLAGAYGQPAVFNAVPVGGGSGGGGNDPVTSNTLSYDSSTGTLTSTVGNSGSATSSVVIPSGGSGGNYIPIDSAAPSPQTESVSANNANGEFVVYGSKGSDITAMFELQPELPAVNLATIDNNGNSSQFATNNADEAIILVNDNVNGNEGSVKVTPNDATISVENGKPTAFVTTRHVGTGTPDEHNEVALGIGDESNPDHYLLIHEGGAKLDNYEIITNNSKNSSQDPLTDGEYIMGVESGTWKWKDYVSPSITDIQVDGTSVVSGGVANVPEAMSKEYSKAINSRRNIDNVMLTEGTRFSSIHDIFRVCKNNDYPSVYRDAFTMDLRWVSTTGTIIRFTFTWSGGSSGQITVTNNSNSIIRYGTTDLAPGDSKTATSRYDTLTYTSSATLTEKIFRVETDSGIHYDHLYAGDPVDNQLLTVVSTNSTQMFAQIATPQDTNLTLVDRTGVLTSSQYADLLYRQTKAPDLLSVGVNGSWVDVTGGLAKRALVPTGFSFSQASSGDVKIRITGTEYGSADLTTANYDLYITDNGTTFQQVTPNNVIPISSISSTTEAIIVPTGKTPSNTTARYAFPVGIFAPSAAAASTYFSAWRTPDATDGNSTEDQYTLYSYNLPAGSYVATLKHDSASAYDVIQPITVSTSPNITRVDLKADTAIYDRTVSYGIELHKGTQLGDIVYTQKFSPQNTLYVQNLGTVTEYYNYNGTNDLEIPVGETIATRLQVGDIAVFIADFSDGAVVNKRIVGTITDIRAYIDDPSRVPSIVLANYREEDIMFKSIEAHWGIPNSAFVDNGHLLIVNATTGVPVGDSFTTIRTTGATIPSNGTLFYVDDVRLIGSTPIMVSVDGANVSCMALPNGASGFQIINTGARDINGSVFEIDWAQLNGQLEVGDPERSKYITKIITDTPVVLGGE